jgi:palmitoyltransferase
VTEAYRKTLGLNKEEEVVARGFFLKTCEKCNCVKPPLTHHCSTCQRCVMRMDHHCPFVANCVGIANQKYFILFCTYLLLTCVYALVIYVKSIITCYLSEDAFCPSSKAVRALTLVMTMVTTASILFLSKLLCE